ncbi:hypothetical protein [Nocardia paucivorans]|uniref:hypothetical protein n=1 Tax=Nocardia paucivorans TaxID=114259 RepID=UPI0002FAE085|nr:hypothetical protein [Nocardia paucivorans]
MVELRRLPLRRLLWLREQAQCSDNTAAVRILDRLLAERRAEKEAHTSGTGPR